MRFEESTLAGACLVTSEPACDERGFFTRTFCVREFAERGLETIFVQHSTSYNIKRGTLRGMHFQRPPHDEVKLVSCLKGAIQDVIIDLRPGSATFGCWEAFELTERNRCRLYIPKGFAHGFQTLADDTEVGYLISQFHVPNAAAGSRLRDRLAPASNRSVGQGPELAGLRHLVRTLLGAEGRTVRHRTVRSERAMAVISGEGIYP
jgi:dTDP-4-dehydrorhamnose 3,5-epimerase